MATLDALMPTSILISTLSRKISEFIASKVFPPRIRLDQTKQHTQIIIIKLRVHGNHTVLNCQRCF